MLNKNQFLWSISVALSGFLFGFDTVVISGANLPIKELWNTSPWFHGTFIMSMALWGTVMGSLLGGYPTQRWGRKNTLIVIGILYFISAIGSAMAGGPYWFSFFRFIGGLGVGASTVAGPIYISEISNSENRGKLVALYQFNIVLGILIAYLSNYLLEGFQEGNDWRWMLGVEAIPAVIYVSLVFFIPKSPRWLILYKKDLEVGRKVLQKMGIQNIEQELKIIQKTITTKKSVKSFLKLYQTPLILSFLIAFFNQLSGINFILYYAPEILEMAGLATKESLYNSIAIGAVNLVFTLAGIYLIDKAGRKSLLIIGSVGYVLSLSMISWSFYAGNSPFVLLISILVFISSHAIGQGAIIWVFIAEIFPNHARAFGQSWGTGVHWVLAATITLVAPIAIDWFRENPWPIFVFFTFMMALQLVFSIFFMPETKGKSLEDLGKTILNK